MPMPTDCVTFDLAYVDAPDFEAAKVKVVMTERHLTVQNLRGVMLLELDDVERVAEPESDGRRFFFGEGDEQVIIQKMDGCRCGGTSFTERRRSAFA